MQPDVMIVGGGVIGTACAYYLARRDRSVMIVERRHLAAGASGSSAAMIGCGSGMPAPLLAPARESARLIREVEEATGIDLEIVRGGALTVAAGETAMEGLHARAREDHALNIAAELLDRTDARHLEPLLSPHIHGALFHPDDFHLNPFRLCRAFLHGARRRGATMHCGVAVHDIQVDDGRLKQVVTDAGVFHPRRVVVAGGAAGAQVLSRTGTPLPVVPARGQAIVTEACPPMTPRIINCARHLYVRQGASGNFYLGSATEYVGFDRRITLPKIAAYTRGIAFVVPVIGHLRAVRFFTGFRPMTPDGLPILGPWPPCPQVVIATGHGRSGMLLSAITGRAISELIVDGVTQHPIDALRINRFEKPRHGEDAA